MDDDALARRLATIAGDALLDVQRMHGSSTADVATLKALGDRTAQSVLADELAAERPQDSVLSEEAKDDPARLSANRVWIIDPLDGTREFAEARDDWAVHVALWEDGRLVSGAVALPALGLTLGADDPTKIWPVPHPMRIAVSRTRPSDLVISVAAALGAELVPMGSAGFKTSAVVRGEVDAYLHTGGQYEWDSAAPVAIAQAAGLFAARIDGSRLEYNRPDPYLPDLMICNPNLSTELLAQVQAYTRGEK